MKKISLILIAVCCILSLGYGQNKVTSELRSAARSAQPDEKIPVVITLARQYDASTLDQRTSSMSRKEKTAFVADELKSFSKTSQQQLLKELRNAKGKVEDIQSYWIFNGISCLATPSYIESLASRPEVEEISLNDESPSTTLEYQDFPTGGDRDLFWNLEKIRIQEVWNYNGNTGYTGQDIIVAVIDGGMNYNHPDLARHVWKSNPTYPYGGYNFVANNKNPMDDVNSGNGQGTMISGIIAGDGQGGSITGTAVGAKIMALKVSTSGGLVTEQRILSAMEFALDKGADVVVITACEEQAGAKKSYRDAMVNLNNAGLAAISAAGDRGHNLAAPNSIAGPSNCPSPWHNPEESMNGGHSANICVGATNNNDYKKITSSVGPVSWSGVTGYNDYPYTPGSTTLTGHIRPDVSAPGEGIVSTHYYGEGYRVGSGTPMAAAHVAGIAAILLQVNPEYTPAQIDEFLETTAVKCEYLINKNNYYGAGRIDAYEAVCKALSTVNAPTNVTATANRRQITVNWSGSASSYDIYCDEVRIASNVTGHTYTHTTDHGGTHLFYVKAKSQGKYSPKSNYASVFVDPEGPRVENLTATVVGEENVVTLNWDAPAPASNLRYGNANSTNTNFGNHDGNSHPVATYWAQRFNTKTLLNYVGNNIDSLSIFINKAGTYYLYVYEGTPNGPASDPLFTTTINATAGNVHTWYKVPVTPAISIDPTKDLWYVARTTYQVEDPATYCVIPENTTGFTSLTSTDGKNWTTRSNSWAWMIKGHLTSSNYSYNVQRNGQTIASNLTTLSYVNNNVPAGVHQYTVTTNYGNPAKESFPCEPVTATVQTHFVVTFNAGNGTSPIPYIQQEVTGDPIVLPTAIPSEVCAQEGFVFVGWTTQALPITEEEPEGLLLADSLYYPQGNETLYAVYTNDNEAVYVWCPAYSIYDNQRVCIVSQDYQVEFNDFNNSTYFATTSSMSGGLQALHPFTVVETENGFYLMDDNHRYLSYLGNGLIYGQPSPNDQCRWDIEIIDGQAILRKTYGSENCQLTAFTSGNQTLIGGIDYNNEWPSHRKHLQLYHFVNASYTYYAHNPGCGTTAMTPTILPVSYDNELHLDPVQVTMSTPTLGTQIYYTTNGNTPTSNSTLYQGTPVVISENTTVKARAIKSGLTNSTVASQVYRFPNAFVSIGSFKEAVAEGRIANIQADLAVTHPFGRGFYLSDGEQGIYVHDDYHFLSANLEECDLMSHISLRHDTLEEQPRWVLVNDVEKVGETDEVLPRTASISEIINTYDEFESMLVLLDKVHFTSDYTWTGHASDPVAFIQKGSQQLRVSNYFQGLARSVDTEHLYDVVGIIAKEGDDVVLYPRRNNDIRSYYNITCLPSEHGTVSYPEGIASNLTHVTLTVNPDNNYHVSKLYYYTTDPEVTTDINPETMTFVMPAEDITVVAAFEENQLFTVVLNPGTGSCPSTLLPEITWHSGVVLPAATPAPSCTAEGYTFAGWATYFVEETMVSPELYQAGQRYYPTQNITLYAVYTAGTTEWRDITELSDLREGNYIIGTEYNKNLYYLPFAGATSSVSIPRMKLSATGEPTSAPQLGNGQPLAPENLWTITKTNATQYSITHEQNGVTYYLKSNKDAVWSIQVTVYEPTCGWEITQNNTKGMMLRFPIPQLDPTKEVRYLDRGSGNWAYHPLYDYVGKIHLYLSPSSFYCSAPVCMEVAAPVFQNVPQGTILDNNYMVTITCPTAGAEIYYTTNGDTPSLNSTLYTGPFAISETCTINAIAYAEGNPSEVSSQTFTFPAPFENIAAFKAAYTATSEIASKITGDVQFVQRIGKYVYICDNSAGLVIIDDNNVITSTYDNGDIIQGGIIGTYYKTNSQPSMKPLANPAPGVSGTPVLPIEITTYQLANSGYEVYDAKLVTIVDCSFTSSFQFNQTNKGFNINNSINVYDLYRTLTIGGTNSDHWDITGFVGRNGSIKRVYPRTNNDINKYYSITCQAVEHGTITTNPANRAHQNDVVSLIGHPNPIFQVQAWTVRDSYNNQVPVTNDSFVMPASPVTVSAVIDTAYYTVTVSTNLPGAGSVSGAGVYKHGSSVTVTTVPNPGFNFLHWLSNGQIVNAYSYHTSFTFTITQNMNMVAVYEGSAPVTVEQIIPMTNGWNWFSSYVEYEEGSLAELENQISGEGLKAIIKSQNQFVSNDNNMGMWTGSLEELSNTDMYMLQISAATDITFNGRVANPANHPINLKSGWNWISFLSPEEIEVTDALASITPSHGDILKGQDGFTQFNGSTNQWFGSLTVMIPNEGFMYMNQGTAQTLVYPEASKGSVGKVERKLHWNNDVHQFANNLSMMVTLDGCPLTDGALEVGAFVGDECRGSGRIEYLEALGTYVAFVSVSGTEGETVGFKVYDVASEEELEARVAERITFSTNDVYGSVSNPYVLHLNANGVNEQNRQVSMFPNPSNDKVFITGHGLQSVKVFNAFGQLVQERSFAPTDQVEVEMSSFSAGVYMISVSDLDGQITNKSILKK